MKVYPRNKLAHWGKVECDLNITELAGHVKGKWAAYARITQQQFKRVGGDTIPEWAWVGVGWNGSYDDSHYNPFILVVGRSPSRARKRLKKALSLIPGLL